MKPAIRLLTLLGLCAASLVGLSQTTPTTPTEPASTPVVTTDGTTTTPAGQTTPAAETPAAPPAETPAAPPATPPAAEPSGTPAAAPTVAAAEQPATGTAPAAEAPAKTPESTPAATPMAPGTIIPIIVMDDVPLTDAIRNLARQASLNYMIDPKIGFGQPDPNTGKVVPQPSVSIRWENVTAAQALNALLNNHSLQLVEDPDTHIAQIKIKDPAAPEPLDTRIIQLKFAGPTNILPQIQSALVDKRSKVVADVRTSQLVVVGTKKELVDVENMIQHLDTATKQVLIEARMVETSMNPKTSKGVDWTGTVGAQKVTFGNGATFGTETRTSVSQPVNQSNANPGGVNDTVKTVLTSILGSGGLSLNTARGLSPATAFLNADGVSAVLSFINNYSESRVISCPRTVTLDNETAHIAVTRASPIINITPGTVQVSGGSTITYTNLGVILDVTPRISANSFVNLKVVPEVSRVADTVTKIVNDGTFIVDEYDMRRIDTHVMIPSGNTLVLGGLVSDDVNNGNIKVPILGDIPGLGPIFRKDTKERKRSNLIVFITPTIVQDEDYQPTASTFLRTPVPTKDSVDEKDWSAWDSGKPLWSKKYKGYDPSKNPEAASK